jgi:CRP-like cAMP-binding protein
VIERSWWNKWITLVIFYNFIMVPLRCGFFPTLVSPVLIALDYFGDACLLAGIFVRSRTAYSDHGVLIVDLEQVQRQYFGSVWFPLDLFASLPLLDFFMLGYGMNAVWRLPRLLLVPRLFRRDHARLTANEHMHSIVDLMCLILVSVHLFACGFFAFTQFDGFAAPGVAASWLPDESYVNASLARRYMRSTYFSFTHLTAYGNMIRPQTNAQFIYTIIIMLFGKLSIAFFVGSVAGIMTELGLHKTRFGSTLNQMDQFANQYRLPADLTRRINTYLEHAWSLRTGFDPNEALQMIPHELRSIITLQIAGDMMRKLPMFAGCHDSFIRLLAGELLFECYPAGEFLFYKGQVGSKMFFVVRGSIGLILHPEQSLKPFKVIGRGSFFGEAALTLGKRGASARAHSSVQVLTLSNEALKRVIKVFPEFQNMIQKVATARAQDNAQRKDAVVGPPALLVRSQSELAPPGMSRHRHAQAAAEAEVDVERGAFNEAARPPVPSPSLSPVTDADEASSTLGELLSPPVP